MRRSRLWWLLIPAILLCVTRGALAAPKDATRLALVIGNADYRAGRLPTAANDAGLVAQSLAQVGFDVTAMGDVDAATFRKTVATFVAKVREAGAGALVFVYLSGYGVQYAGDNFLVPLDARIDRQTEVPGAAVPLSEIQTTLEALPARARLFVYDLARENSIAKADAIPLARGLTLLHAPHGSLYAFNAAPGTVGRPDLSPYGVYARALAEMLRTPGLTAQALFLRLRLRVAEITSGAVVPWDESDLDADVTVLASDAGQLVGRPDALGGGLSAETAYWRTVAQDRFATYQAFVRTYPSEGLAVRMKAMLALRLEAATWSESVRVNTSAAYWAYMQRYPRGPHYVDVRRRLAAIHAALEPPSRFEPYVFADLPPPTPEREPSIDRPLLTFDYGDGPPIPRMPEDLLPPAPAATDLELAPPPLVPVGVLPIPAPLPSVAVKAWPEAPGAIRQPFVPGLGLVSVETEPTDAGAVMSLSTAAGRVTRTAVSSEKGQRTILEIDAADEIVSRTMVTRSDGSLITITQTGPRGDLLGQVVTRVDPLGERLTTVSDGRGQLVGEIRADRRGVTKEITRGSGALDDATFAWPRLEDRKDLPPTGPSRTSATPAALPLPAVMPPTPMPPTPMPPTPMPPTPMPPPPGTMPVALPALPIIEPPRPLDGPRTNDGVPRTDLGVVKPQTFPRLKTDTPQPDEAPKPMSRPSPAVMSPEQVVPLPVRRPPPGALKPRRGVVPPPIPH